MDERAIDCQDRGAVEVKEEKKDVHTEHCCALCGCKYGEDREEYDGFKGCSVVNGAKKQSFPCGSTSVCYSDDELG